MTPFAQWQQRMGLTSATACARALGIHRTHVHRLASGEVQPSGAVRRLMEVLEHVDRDYVVRADLERVMGDKPS